MKKKKITMVRVMLFALYLVALLYLLFFAEGLGRNNVGGYRYNLVPLNEITRYWNLRSVYPRAFVINLLCNIVAFMPFGYFIALFADRKLSLFLGTLVTFMFSLMIESVQLVLMVGSFDVDDLILNTLGGILGILGYRLSRVLRKYL